MIYRTVRYAMILWLYHSDISLCSCECQT